MLVQRIRCARNGDEMLMTIFCPKCDFLIQPMDGGRFPPWCPHCGEELKRGERQRAAATAPAMPATQTRTASEIAAAFHRRRPAPAPQLCAAIKTAARLPEPSPPAEPQPQPRPAEPPARGETLADEQRRLDADLPLWCRLLRILFG